MIKRIYSEKLKQMLAVFPVVAVIGSRQVGKSTLVNLPEIGAERRYISLDDIAARDMAERDPWSLVASEGAITIDEVQLAPDVLRVVKQEVDKQRVPGRFLVTGSADLNSCAALSEVLAGRVGILRLPPITCFEEHGTGTPLWGRWFSAEKIEDLEEDWGKFRYSEIEWERIHSGGYPLSLTAASSDARAMWMESFRTTYLERDLRRISDIGSLADFARLMELSASRIGSVLNQAELARDAGLSPATAGRYLSILESSFLIHRLSPYYANYGKRLVKSPKLYWNDTGLAAHLMGFASGEEIARDRMSGRFLENFVLMEISALLEIVSPQSRLYYLRTHGGLEIDGMIKIGRRLFPFEVKSSKTVSGDDALPMEKWMEWAQSRHIGIVFYRGKTVKRLSRNVLAAPVSILKRGFAPSLKVVKNR